MPDLCTDNRFELIDKYRQRLIEATNIETSPDEMKALDGILFRFWQMGWLDKIESVPVRQGRWDEEWIPASGGKEYKVWQCSECQNVSTWQTNYCPNCGAKMDIADIGKDNVE